MHAREIETDWNAFYISVESAAHKKNRLQPQMAPGTGKNAVQ